MVYRHFSNKKSKKNWPSVRWYRLLHQQDGTTVVLQVGNHSWGGSFRKQTGLVLDFSTFKFEMNENPKWPFNSLRRLRSLDMELMELQNVGMSGLRQEANWKLQVFLHVFFSASFAHVETQIFATARFFDEFTPATKDGTVCHIQHLNLCNCQMCISYIYILAKKSGHCFKPTQFLCNYNLYLVPDHPRTGPVLVRARAIGMGQDPPLFTFK